MDSLKEKLKKILLKSQSLFKTDMLYAARGGFWLTFGQVGSIIFGFILSIGFANLLLPEIYGVYKYILSLGGLITIFSLSGLSPALIRSVSKGYEGSLKVATKRSLLWGINIFLLAAIISIYYFYKGNNLLAIGILIVGTFSPLIDSAELYSAFLSGKKDFYRISLLNISRSLFTTIIILTTIVVSKNPLVILFSYFISNLISVTFFYWFVKTIYRPNKNIDPENIKLGTHTSLTYIIASFAEKIDNILIFHYLGAVQLAIYNFAQLIPINLNGIVKNIGLLAIPKFANNDKSKTQRSLAIKSFYISVVGFIFFIVYIFICPIFFKIFFPQYMASVVYSQIFGAIMLFQGVLASSFLEAQYAVKEKYVAVLATNIFRLFAVFIGVYYFGLMGVVIARILSKMLGVSIAFFFAQKI